MTVNKKFLNQFTVKELNNLPVLILLLLKLGNNKKVVLSLCQIQIRPLICYNKFSAEILRKSFLMTTEQPGGLGRPLGHEVQCSEVQGGAFWPSNPKYSYVMNGVELNWRRARRRRI